MLAGIVSCMGIYIYIESDFKQLVEKVEYLEKKSLAGLFLRLLKINLSTKFLKWKKNSCLSFGC